ncbi:unnamed protein product, partial [Rotaria sp. Silwood1]
MRISNISNIPNRPIIQRMSQRELQEIRTSNDLNYPSMTSTSKWINRSQSQVIPEIHNSVRLSEGLPRNLNNHEQEKSLFRRPWFWIFAAVFCLILIVAIVAIVLGIIL